MQVDSGAAKAEPVQAKTEPEQVKTEPEQANVEADPTKPKVKAESMQPKAEAMPMRPEISVEVKPVEPKPEAKLPYYEDIQECSQVPMSLDECLGACDLRSLSGLVAAVA